MVVEVKNWLAFKYTCDNFSPTPWAVDLAICLPFHAELMK